MYSQVQDGYLRDMWVNRDLVSKKYDIPFKLHRRMPGFGNIAFSFDCDCLFKPL